MTQQVGISGFAVYVPPYRVDLESWCQWTGSPWDKTRAVVGRSFRMRGPAQSVYTMAATAVMRLIEAYGVDPERVGCATQDLAAQTYRQRHARRGAP